MSRRPFAVPALSPLLALTLLLAASGCQTSGAGSGLQAGNLAENTAQSGSGDTPSSPAGPDFLQLQDSDALLQAGMQLDELGRHDKAEQAFRRAMLLMEAEHGPDSPLLGDVLTLLGTEISLQGRFAEADLSYERADNLVRNSANALDLPRLMTSRASHLARQGRLEDARAMALAAREERRKLLKAGAAEARNNGIDPLSANEDNLSDMAAGLMIEADIALRMDLLDEAKLAANLARRIVARSELAPDWWIAPIDELLAAIEIREDGLNDAETKLQQALITRRVAQGETRPAARTMLMLGGLYARQGRTEESVTAMRRGLDIIREEKPDMQGVSTDEVVTFLQAAWQEMQINPDSTASLKTEMFEAAQLGREGVTARTIARTAARLGSGQEGVSALVRKVQAATHRRDSLRIELGRLSAIPASERTPGAIERYRADYIAARDIADGLEKDLHKTFPGYRQLVGSQPVSVKDITGLLKPDEALIQFIIGSESGFLFVLRPGGVFIHPLDITSRDLDQAVAQLRSAFEVTDGTIRPFDTMTAWQLYQKLLLPAEQDLAGVDHLAVVPGGALLSLPLSLLLTGPVQPGSEAYSGMPWLARDMAISTLPSLRAFSDLRGRVEPSKAPKPFLGFGNPGFAGGGGGLDNLASHCRANSPVPPALIRGLSPLPNTGPEVQQVATALGASSSDVFLGSQVTEGLVRRQPLSRYRVLYFATHGLLPGELACQSEPALALTPPSSPVSDFARDGLLDASEIAGLDLDADLVALSACNTGGGSGHFGGESLSGLARSFFYAGARALLVSHWQVDSRATRSLMTGMFTRYGRKGAGHGADALQEAQLALLSSPATGHPFFWAAFTLVGDGNRGDGPPSRPADQGQQALE